MSSKVTKISQQAIDTVSGATSLEPVREASFSVPSTGLVNEEFKLSYATEPLHEKSAAELHEYSMQSGKSFGHISSTSETTDNSTDGISRSASVLSLSTWEEKTERKAKEMSIDNTKYVHAAGRRFLCLFGAFSVTQNLESSITDMGIWVLIGMYVCFALSNLMLASPAVGILMPKRAFVLGSVCYAVYVSTHCIPWNEMYTVCVFIGACLAGFGGSLVWTAQQAYLYQCAAGQDDLYGNFNQEFYSIFGLQQILSNGTVALLYYIGVPQQLILICLALMSWLAVGYFSTIHSFDDDPKPGYEKLNPSARTLSAPRRHEPSVPDPAVAGRVGATAVVLTASSAAKDTQSTAAKRGRHILREVCMKSTDVLFLVIREPRKMIPLMTMYALTGFMYALSVSYLPRLVPTIGLKTTMMVGWGIMAWTGSKVGRYSDRHGKFPVLALIAVLVLISACLVLGGYFSTRSGVHLGYLLYMAACVTFGAAYSMTSVLHNSVNSLHHGKNIHVSTPAFLIVWNGFICIGLFLMNYFSGPVLIVVLVTLLATGISSLYFLDRYVEPIDTITSRKTAFVPEVETELVEPTPDC